MKLWPLLFLLFGSAAAAQTTKPLPPELNLTVARDAAPGPKIRLTLNGRNIDAVTLRATPLDPEPWLRTRESEKPLLPRALGPTKTLGTVHLLAQRTAQEASRIDRYGSKQFNLPPLAPGVYRLTAESAGRRAVGIVNITHLAVLVKRAPRAALVWVTDHKSGRVIPAARVRVVSKSGAVLAQGTTGSDGAVRLAVAPAVGQVVLVQTAQDAAGVASGVEDPDGKLLTHLSTDRPLYRPGQTVAWKAILRTTKGSGYLPVVGQKVSVEFRDSRESVIQRTTATSTTFGTLSGTLALPQELALGPGSLVLTWGKQSAYATVSIAAYRKPEFTVTTRPEKPRFFAGEPATLILDAQYLFGAAVPGAKVRYQVRRAPHPWSPSDDTDRWYGSGDGNLYPSDTYQSDPFVAEGEVQTGPEGRVRITFPTAKDTPDSDYQLTATIIDSQQHQVETSATVTVYAAQLRLALSVTDQCVAQGTTFPVQVRVVDLEGKPTQALVTVTAERFDKVWQTVAKAQVRAPGTTTLPAQGSGTLRLTARTTDATGRVALARTQVWVVSSDYKASTVVVPEVQVRLDRKHYAPGAMAKAFITTNTPTRPVLVTLEGSDLFQWVVLPPGKRSTVWSIPTRTALSPNAFVEATQWAAPAELVSGSALLALPDPSRKLTVRITPNKPRYAPGESATATVRLTDATGKPVRGEVALGVVDAALYALRPESTPELFTHFWGRRENQVQTFQSAPEEVSGGAYQRANGGNAPVRQRFVDTAFWEAHLVTTAQDGTAQVSFPVPDNLTTWRWTARAVTEATQVGEATTDTLATRPVTLRLGTPRGLTVGDSVVLTGTINNRTDTPQPVRLSLTSEGGTVSPLDLPTQVPAHGEAVARWQLTVESKAPTLTLEAAVRTGEQVLDQLRVGVPVVPQGVPERWVQSTTLGTPRTLTLPVPPRAERAELRVQVYPSLRAAALTLAETVLARPLSTPLDAAGRLLVAAPRGRGEIRPALLLLARTQNPDGGWGSWEGAPSNARVTAQVLRALAVTKGEYPPRLRVGAQEACLRLFAQLEVWETRATLAAALKEAGDPKAPALLEEVTRRGWGSLSPWARARLASPTKLPPLENDQVPAGEGFGWRATAVETTAEALPLLRPEEAARAARGLASPNTWRTEQEDAAAACALLRYTAQHPEPEGTAAGVRVALNNEAPQALAPDGTLRLALPPGASSPTLTLTGGSASTLATVEVRWWAVPPAETPPHGGLQLLRRIEAQDRDGLWRELKPDGAILPVGTALRVTLLVWGSARTEQLHIDEQLPSGFEFVESLAQWPAQTEARDTRLRHTIEPQADSPVTLTYYLRAELAGAPRAFPPARAENARQPQEYTLSPDRYVVETRTP